MVLVLAPGIFDSVIVAVPIEPSCSYDYTEEVEIMEVVVLDIPVDIQSCLPVAYILVVASAEMQGEHEEVLRKLGCGRFLVPLQVPH